MLGIGYLRAFYGVQLRDGTSLASLWIVIVLALAIRRLPYALRACYAALQQISVSLEEAAENLGATKLRTVRRIVMPLMMGGILAGFVTSFATAAVELSATLMLVQSNSDAPLAYGLYVLMQSSAGRGPGAALGVIAVVLVAACTLLSHLVIERGRITCASETLIHDAAISDIAVPAVGIRIEQVNLSYGDNHVLTDRSISTSDPGELFAFLGPSGCGKTTLLRLIAGFNRADSGRVLVGGQDISALPPWKRDIGMVFQSYALWPHMTVARNVAFGLEEKRVPRAEIGPRVAAALELVGLTGLGQRRPAQLSGGQQQRVALARTIAVEPKVLLLDEPLSNLDAKLRVQVRRELRELQQRLGLTTIFVTHDQEEANTICDRIAVHERRRHSAGRDAEAALRAAGQSVRGELSRHREYSRRPRVRRRRFARIRGLGRLAHSGAAGPAKVPPHAKVVFRPQDASIMAAGEAAGPGTAVVTGTVSYREFLGSSVRYGVRDGYGRYRGRLSVSRR